MVTKEYLENEYRLAVLDFRAAKNEDGQWEARKTMARLEKLAVLAYGAEYADALAMDAKKDLCE